MGSNENPPLSTDLNNPAVEVISDLNRPAPPVYRPIGLPSGPRPPLMFTPPIGFKTPNGEPMNWQYLHDHHRATWVPGWWREATAILNNYIVHAQVIKDPNWVPHRGVTQPLVLTGHYYGLNGLREIPLL